MSESEEDKKETPVKDAVVDGAAQVILEGAVSGVADVVKSVAGIAEGASEVLVKSAEAGAEVAVEVVKGAAEVAGDIASNIDL